MMVNGTEYERFASRGISIGLIKPAIILFEPRLIPKEEGLIKIFDIRPQT